MLLRTEDVISFSIKLPNEIRGDIIDMYFDDLFWKIQYILIKLGKSMDEKLILIPQTDLVIVDTRSRKISDCFISDIGNINNDKKILSGEVFNAIIKTEKILEVPIQQGNLKQLSMREIKDVIIKILMDENYISEYSSSHLRSRNSMRGYSIQAKCREMIGHIADIIIEIETWKIRYILIAMHNWMKADKKIPISPAWIEKIKWSDNQVIIDFKKEVLTNSPALAKDSTIDRDFERALQYYYNKQRGR